MRKSLGTAAALLAVLTLTGCGSTAATPTPEAVAETFTAEYSAVTGLDWADVEEVTGEDLSGEIAADLAEGRCDQPAYFAGMGDPSLVAAVQATCAVHYPAR